MLEFDLVVIGGGSAGLKTARVVAKQGYRVAVAEERELGGECFWAGCVPTKAMIRSAQVWRLVQNAEKFGIRAGDVHASFAQAMAYKDEAKRKVGGDPNSDAGLSKMGGRLFRAHAKLEGAHEVRIGEEVVRGEKIVIATGTSPAIPPVPGLAEAGYITNREATSLASLPKRIVVLGAGVIGLEFAQTFRRFGAEVTVVEMGAQILPREDREVAALAQSFLEREGVRILTATQAKRAGRVREKGLGVAKKGGETGEKWLDVEQNGVLTTLFCDEILVATGRKAATESLQLERAGLELERNYLRVDSCLRTSVPHIFAPGDIHGGYLFTHVASYEGKIAAHNLYAPEPIETDYRVIPRCTFLDPEIASIGITEGEAERGGVPFRVLRAELSDMDRSILHGSDEGLVKIIVEERGGRILGAHIIGHEASSLIAEIAICMQNNLPISAIANTMHAYPSFPEAIEAAALQY